MRFKTLAALAGATLLALPALAQNADGIKARKDNFQEMRRQTAAVKAVVDAGGPPAAALPAAQALDAAMAKAAGLFGPDTRTGDTKALAAIWTDQAGFSRVAGAAKAASAKLVAAAGGSDAAALGVAFREMGAACGACHDGYRAK